MSDLAPDLLPFLDMLAAPGVVPTYESTPDEAREAFRVLTVLLRGAEHEVTGVTSTDETFAGLPARVYRPADPEPEGLPTVVFLHGGGFVIGDLDTHDPVCRRIARACSAVVVALDYPLAPEHPFPSAVDAVIPAVREAHQRLGDLGGNDLLAVAGDSAGGNLAAVTAQALRDVVSAQLLLYPKVDSAPGYPSLVENGAGYFLDAPTMDWFGAHYAGPEPAMESADDPRLSPLRGDLSGLAPCVVATAELDPLRDEGEAYAAALEEAGVRAELVRYDGQIHGFANLDHVAPSCGAALDDALIRFRALLH